MERPTVEDTTRLPSLSLEERKLEAYRVASEMFKQRPDWVTFFREIMGSDGVARRLFADPKDFDWFQGETEYGHMRRMLGMLRNASADGFGKETIKIITVRLPESLHMSLRAEAKDRNVSMNQLCISKLLQAIENKMDDLDFDDLFPTHESASHRGHGVRPQAEMASS